MELKAAANAEYIKQLVENVLEKYNLVLAQVYSVTTGNGSNSIKRSKLISKALNIEEESKEVRFKRRTVERSLIWIKHES